MEIRQTSDEGMTIFRTAPARFFSDESREAEDLFSSIAAKHSLMSKGGRCEKEQAIDPEGNALVIDKMYVPVRSRLREPIVKDFEQGGHTVRSNAT